MNLFLFQLQSADEAILGPDEARHCVRVMRKKKGEIIFGIDGLGNMYRGRIDSLGKDTVEVKLLEKTENWGEHPYEIILGAPILRQADRMEWLLEKAVELGVTRIQPLVSKYTVKPRIKLERMQKIMFSALKQCKRSRLPLLSEPVNLGEFLDEPFKGLGLIGWCEENYSINELSDEIQEVNGVRLLVGPEGGFHEEEVASAKDAGFHSVRMGENRLRAETAGVHLLSIIKFLKSY